MYNSFPVKVTTEIIERRLDKFNVSLEKYVVCVTGGKVMVGNSGGKMIVNSGKWTCGVCGKGVQANSVQYTVCKKWIHKWCSGVRGDLSRVADGFRCRRCDGTIQEVDLQTTTKPTDLYQLQESRLDTIYRRHRVRFRSDHHTHQHTHCQQNFHKHHTDGRQAEHTKGQDAQQLRALARRHSMQNHSKK